MASELERTVEYLLRVSKAYRRVLYFCGCFVLLIILLSYLRGITTLVLASYGTALLLDPLLANAERRGMSRSKTLILYTISITLFFIAFILLAIPTLVTEVRTLTAFLPTMIQKVEELVKGNLRDWFGITLAQGGDQVSDYLKSVVKDIRFEQVRPLLRGVGNTLIHGYSWVMTLVNLFLFPFIVFYLARDLSQIHSFVGGFLRDDVKENIAVVGGQILENVQAFVRGQLLVSFILAVLYVVGFSIVGLHSALLVGLLTGFLNIIPYLGVGIGLILASLLTLSHDPELLQFVYVYAVFGVVQALEGNLITPKIVGESVGIHPLGVILALVVGAELLGLLGMVIAIPAAASIGVVFRRGLEIIDTD